jgi:hypothetical protein
MDLKNAILHVRRVKQGTPATQPLAAASYAHCGWAVVQ